MARTKKASSFFKGIGEASTPGGKLPTTIGMPGSYAVKVQAVKAVEGFNGNYFIVEMAICQSDNDQRPVDTKMAWIVGMDKPSALTNVREFVSIAADMDFSEVSEAECEGASNSEQPLAGVYMELTLTQITTRKGSEFTAASWALIGDNDDYSEMFPTIKKKVSRKKKRR